jgi:RNA polymerase sigma-70 factor (ECF subfamily)
MDAPPIEEVERRIQRLFEQGDHEGAATEIIRAYGGEILSFLSAVHRSQSEASEVFSYFAEGVWRGLPSFTPQGAFRSWAYAIARKSSLRHRRDKHRREARFEALPQGSAFLVAVNELRTGTPWYVRTETRSRFAAIRDSLPPEDRELLVLRVDRKLPWNDLAQMLRDDGDEPLTGEALKREAARLRKRFQLLASRLREIGRREGLLPADGDES